MKKLNIQIDLSRCIITSKYVILQTFMRANVSINKSKKTIKKFVKSLG